MMDAMPAKAVPLSLSALQHFKVNGTHSEPIESDFVLVVWSGRAGRRGPENPDRDRNRARNMGSQPADRQGGTPEIERIAVGEGAESREIALLRRMGRAPGLFWLGGFKSDMAGTKAEALDAFALRRGLAMTRFDYSGHGVSGGAFADGTISRWLEEALAVFDRMTEGPQILIGSSMGGWLALLLNQAHRNAVGAAAVPGKPLAPEPGMASASQPGAAENQVSRIAGLVLVAPAVDMTRALIWAAMPASVRTELMETGAWLRPSDYSAEPYLITRALIEDGDRHLFGDRLIETGCPVHILQGRLDTDVPWRHAAGLVSRLASDDVILTLIKDGDHRLSRPEDIARLEAAVEGLIAGD